MDDAEYERRRADEKNRENESRVVEQKAEQEYKQRRLRELEGLADTRVHIASRVAAGLAANPQMEADAVAARAISVADALLEQLRQEISDNR